VRGAQRNRSYTRLRKKLKRCHGTLFSGEVALPFSKRWSFWTKVDLDMGILAQREIHEETVLDRHRRVEVDCQTIGTLASRPPLFVLRGVHSARYRRLVTFVLP